MLLDSYLATMKKPHQFVLANAFSYADASAASARIS
jgi:hypothetical protein